ncbi:MAG: hypothetical protein ACFCBU_00660 [Cyanophyceae cyanobacterium]
MLKIQENTGSTLEFSVTPIGLWIFGSVFSIIGLLLIIFLTENTTLYCDRQAQPEPSCEIRTSGIISSETKSFPISKIIQADIEFNSSSDGGETYRNILLVDKSALVKTKNQSSQSLQSDRPIQVPLSFAYSSGYESHVDVANQINGFLENPNQNNFQTQVSSAWIIIIFGGVFFLVGVIVILLSPITVCRMSKFGNQLEFEHRKLWGKSMREVSLNEVIGPRLDVSRSSRGSETMRVGIELENREVLWFGVGYDNINNGQKYRISDLITDFLNQQKTR